MQIMESDLHQLTETVWTSILGPDVVVSPVNSDTQLKDPLTGSVEIVGAWEGVVLLSCSRSLLRRAAREIFQVAEQDLTPEQLQDTLAELTNITAGNVKPLLEQPAYLSLPTMPSEKEREGHLRRGELIAKAISAADDDPFGVMVLKRGANGEKAPQP